MMWKSSAKRACSSINQVLLTGSCASSLAHTGQLAATDVASTQAQGPRQLQWARMPKERSVGPFYVLWRKSVDLSIFTCVQWDRSVEETCFVKILQWDRSMEIFFFLKFSKTFLSQENPNGNAPKVCGLMFFHYSIRVHSHCPFSPF